MIKSVDVDFQIMISLIRLSFKSFVPFISLPKKQNKTTAKIYICTYIYESSSFSMNFYQCFEWEKQKNINKYNRQIYLVYFADHLFCSLCEIPEYYAVPP